MAQSLSRIILHVIFSTKDRQAFLDQSMRASLHAYLATVCRGLKADAYRVGGAVDHVHLACSLPRTLPVSKLIEEIKTSSSKWIKEQDARYQSFYWQNGYGAFSVAPTQLDQLIAYIENQEEHHKKVSFQDEYRKILAKYEIDFDERYVWD